MNGYRLSALLPVLAAGAAALASHGGDVKTVEPFSLSDVKLLPSPFLDARERTADYLLWLEPDRLLHRFRENAGLEPKGEEYGGWEQMTISGHSLGHYLVAVSQQYKATGDERFKAKVDYIVDELAECQAQRADGYVAGFPEGDRLWAEIRAGEIRSQGFDLNGIWVPWYTQHKLFDGLIHAFQLCGNARALVVAKKLGNWAVDVTKDLTDDQWQRMLNCEYGGMNEVLADLYDLTGEEQYLTLSEKFYHHTVMDPLANEQDRLRGLHGNTQIPKVLGAARLYEITQEDRYKTMSEFFWDRVVHHHAYAIGGFTDREYFGPPDVLSERLSTNTAETCKTYNQLKLTRHLFEWEPNAELMDYYERGLYNHILASQSRETGMVTYYMPLATGTVKRFGDRTHDFSCCHGSGMENHTKYPDSIYFHDDSRLYVNLFIPSELNWTDKGLNLRLETEFPQSEVVKMSLRLDQPTTFDLKIRKPYWLAGNAGVMINGSAASATVDADGYLSLRREWRDGDIVALTLPMNLHLDPMPDNPNRTAIMYGPIVLAGDLGPEDRPMGITPVLVTESRNPEDWLEPVAGRPLSFTTRAGRPEQFKLVPFYELQERRQAVYWDLFTEEQWRAYEAEYRAEEERKAALERNSLDVLHIGEMQPERDHNLEGRNTGTGDAFGRKYRHATNGGWFSFEMKVDGDVPVDLICTYWGSDSGGRTFDILVDGEKIATEQLTGKKPNEFMDVVYQIPESLTAGKEKVTIRFEAHPNNFAGGVFGVRTIRRNP